MVAQLCPPNLLMVTRSRISRPDRRCPRSHQSQRRAEKRPTTDRPCQRPDPVVERRKEDLLVTLGLPAAPGASKSPGAGDKSKSAKKGSPAPAPAAGKEASATKSTKKEDASKKEEKGGGAVSKSESKAKPPAP